MPLQPVNLTDPLLTVSTTAGSFVLELFKTQAPITVANFLNYANAAFYTQTFFHRVVDGFVIQTGGYSVNSENYIVAKATSAPIVLESQTGLSNLRGTVAMARTTAADSATSQFYINLVDNQFLNYQSTSSPGYAVFGKVIQGMEVIDTIGKLPVRAIANSQFDSIPSTLININYVKHTRSDIDGAAGQAYRIYKAAFNRDPMNGDTAGLGYWIAQMDKGMSSVQVAAGFIDSKEFKELYGTNSTDGTFITNVYRNVLGRAPDSAGYEWWVTQLATVSEKTRQRVLADFAESPENKETVATLIGNGIIYDPYLG